MTFGEKLIFFRELFGLSQIEMAKKIDVTPSAVSNYETGKRLPDLRTFTRMCAVLGIKQEKFLEGVELEERG